MQPGTGRRQVGQLAFEPDPAPLALEHRVGDRHGREQGDGVRVLRGREDLVRVGDLDELAAVHHGDAVADVAHGREVVRDEEVREAEPALEVHQEVEDLRPHRDVERRHRLVADDQRRIGGERPRDRDALPLPAGELERPPLAEVRAEPDELEQLGHAAAVSSPSRRVGAASAARRRSCSTVISGLSESPGSWNTICTRPRCSAAIPPLPRLERTPLEGDLAPRPLA